MRAGRSCSSALWSTRWSSRAKRGLESCDPWPWAAHSHYSADDDGEHAHTVNLDSLTLLTLVLWYSSQGLYCLWQHTSCYLELHKDAAYSWSFVALYFSFKWRVGLVLIWFTFLLNLFVLFCCSGRRPFRFYRSLIVSAELFVSTTTSQVIM